MGHRRGGLAGDVLLHSDGGTDGVEGGIEHGDGTLAERPRHPAAETVNDTTHEIEGGRIGVCAAVVSNVPGAGSTGTSMYRIVAVGIVVSPQSG